MDLDWQGLVQNMYTNEKVHRIESKPILSVNGIEAENDVINQGIVNSDDTTGNAIANRSALPEGLPVHDTKAEFENVNNQGIPNTEDTADYDMVLTFNLQKDIQKEAGDETQDDIIEEKTSICEVEAARLQQPQPSTLPAPNAYGLRRELRKSKLDRILKPKQVNQLSSTQNNILPKMQIKKQVGMQTDTPPVKRQRKDSSENCPYPLLMGAPAAPPPRVPQRLLKAKRPRISHASTQTAKPNRSTVPRSGLSTTESVPSSAANTRGHTLATGMLHGRNEEPCGHGIVEVKLEIDGTSIGPDNSPVVQVPSTSKSVPVLKMHAEDASPGASVKSSSNNNYPSNVVEQMKEDVPESKHTVASRGRDVQRNIENGVMGYRCKKKDPRRFPATIDGLTSHLADAILEMDEADDDETLWLVSRRDMLEFNWTNNPNGFTGQRDVFLGPAGPTFEGILMSPFQIFEKIWDRDIMDFIVRETNKYGAECKPATADLSLWVPITVTELWRFFAILILQSLMSIAVEREYWTPIVSHLKIGDFTSIMSFKRFRHIKRCINLINNLPSSNASMISQISPIVEHLNRKFSSLYLPDQNIVIDDSFLVWKGRLSFPQLIKTKAKAKEGLKSYEVYESRTGYLWKMIFYSGQGQNFDATTKFKHESDAHFEGASKIILDLVYPLLNKGHTLVMNNFNNSPLLSRILKAQKTDTMGTLRLNRRFVPETLRQYAKDMRLGEVAFSQTHDLAVLIWKNEDIVSFISTFHHPKGYRKENNQYKPNVVLDYNLAMGGVDKKDHHLEAFPMERVRSSIWHKKLFFRLLNVSIMNSYIILSHSNPIITHRKFRAKLSDEILQKFKPQDQLKSSLSLSCRLLHVPIRNGSKLKRCKSCAKKNSNTRTWYKCQICDVDLCNQCFEEYHNSL